jgi:hypothetical protein
LNQSKLFMSMLKASKINLVIGYKFLPKVNSKINCISCLINFLLEYMIKTRFRFTLDFYLFLKFLHVNISILANFN